MNKKIKTAIEVVLFWGILVVLLIVASRIVTPKNQNIYDAVNVSVKEEALDEEMENSIDVLFVGDSEVYASFAPLIMYHDYGFTSYLLSTSVQKLCDSYELLRYAFETQKPKVVVLEAGTFYRAAGVEGDGSDLVQAVLEEWFTVFRHHSRWKVPFIAYMGKDNDFEQEALNKGFRYRAAVKPYHGKPFSTISKSKRPFAADVTDYVNKIRMLCEENGAQLLLINAPSVRSWSMDQHNAVAGYAMEQELPYLDLNLIDLGIDWLTETKDSGIHLNFPGACKVTVYTGEYLSTTYGLTDHRQDERYEPWNESCHEFYANYVTEELADILPGDI